MIKVTEQIKGLNVLKMLKDSGSIMEGHFKLTSGYHSKYYLQCAQLLQYPDLTSKIARQAVDILGREIDIEKIKTVISPAVGGILFGYMLAYRMNTKMIFAERKNSSMELRRGFKINPGEKIIIAEDVITTGGSVNEVIDICKDSNARIEAIISIVDRSYGVKFDFPYFSLIKLNIEKYLPSRCPLCRNNLKIVYPGSKK